MSYLTKEQLQSLIRPKFGDDVEIICEHPVILGDVLMTPFGLLGTILVCRDHDTGKKFAVQVPLGIGIQHKEAA